MTAEPQQQRAVGGPVGAGWGWSLLLPPGWVSLPVERSAARAAVRALLDRRFAGLPRDAVAPLRIQVDRELRALLRQAEEGGASSAHVHLELLRGLPVSGSLTVGLVEPGAGGRELEEALRARLGEGGDVVEHGPGELAGLPALRRRRRVPQPRPDGAPGPAPVTTGVDWVVPLPDEDGFLVLSFATSTEPIADELVELFDAIAGSLDLVAR